MFFISSHVTHPVLHSFPTRRSSDLASFIVPKGTPGISQGAKHKKMGIRASHTAEVLLDDCRIPGDYLLGGEERLEKRLRSEEHTSELQSHVNLVCRLLLEKKNNTSR